MEIAVNNFLDGFLVLTELTMGHIIFQDVMPQSHEHSPSIRL
jgi:hypothetical protein